MRALSSTLFWDCFCLTSLVGIWPRYIEPKLLKTNRLNIPIPNLPTSLSGLKIVHFSDLHFQHSTSQRFLSKISRQINALSPDLILFTGDFICYSQLVQPQRLKDFLCSLSAPHGCFAIFGNHDYEKYVSINSLGHYDICTPSTGHHFIFKTLKKLCSRRSGNEKPRVISRVKEVDLNAALMKLLEETPFQLLNNHTTLLPIKESCLNICGLGDYWLDRCDPSKAFEKYDRNYPGIILSHNPDSFPLIEKYPGEIVLSGHTHGVQVNLPWIWKKITALENPRYKRGLVKEKNKYLYISRGVGSADLFRCFSMPELLLLTLCESAKIS